MKSALPNFITTSSLHRDFITSTPRQWQQSAPPTDTSDTPRCAPRRVAAHNAHSNPKQESPLRTAGKRCSAMESILLVLHSRCTAARTPQHLDDARHLGHRSTSTTQDTSGTGGAALRSNADHQRRRPHFSRHAIPPSPPPPSNTREHRPNFGTPARGGQANVVPTSAKRNAPATSF